MTAAYHNPTRTTLIALLNRLDAAERRAADLERQRAAAADELGYYEAVNHEMNGRFTPDAQLLCDRQIEAHENLVCARRHAADVGRGISQNRDQLAAMRAELGERLEDVLLPLLGPALKALADRVSELERRIARRPA